MTQVTAGATQAKTANHAASPFGPPKSEIPNSDLPNIEMPDAFRESTEKGAVRAKDTYEKAKVAAEQATDLLKDTFTTAAKGTTDYNLKVMEIARTNANAAFDYTQELLGVKSLSEFVELSTAHARKQFEAMTAQTKELTEIAQKVTTETAAVGWRQGDTKAFNKVA
jgi:phasin